MLGPQVRAENASADIDSEKAIVAATVAAIARIEPAVMAKFSNARSSAPAAADVARIAALARTVAQVVGADSDTAGV